MVNGNWGAGSGVRVTAFLKLFVLCSIGLLALGACGGSSEGPEAGESPAAAPVQAVTPAPVVIPTRRAIPTLVPAEPVEQAPVATPLVVAPRSSMFARPTETPTPLPTATPVPTATPLPTPTSAPTPLPTATPRPTPTPTVAVVRNPFVQVSPSSGRTGSSVAISGSDFASGSPVSRVTIGGIQVSASASVGANGRFSTSLQVPSLGPGSHIVSVTAGSDTASSSFTVLAEVVEARPVVSPSAQIVSALSALGNNLRWVAYFDNATKSWSLYDPSGTFTVGQLPGFLGPPQSLSSYSPLTQVISGRSYYLNVGRDVDVEIGGKTYELTAGTNLKSW